MLPKVGTMLKGIETWNSFCPSPTLLTVPVVRNQVHCSLAHPSALVGRVAITRHHGQFGFSHRNFFPRSAGGWQSKAKEPAMLPPLGPPG